MIDTGSPNIWSDVNGDYQAARRAAVAMRQAAVALEQGRAERQSLAVSARDHWTGRLAGGFDVRLEAVQRESIDLQAQLMAAARRLDLAAEDAAADQRSRLTAREAGDSWLPRRGAF